jgi:hypothetical protein
MIYHSLIDHKISLQGIMNMIEKGVKLIIMLHLNVFISTNTNE